MMPAVGLPVWSPDVIPRVILLLTVGDTVRRRRHTPRCPAAPMTPRALGPHAGRMAAVHALRRHAARMVVVSAGRHAARMVVVAAGRHAAWRRHAARGHAATWRHGTRRHGAWGHRAWWSTTPWRAIALWATTLWWRAIALWWGATTLRWKAIAVWRHATRRWHAAWGWHASRRCSALWYCVVGHAARWNGAGRRKRTWRQRAGRSHTLWRPTTMWHHAARRRHAVHLRKARAWSGSRQHDAEPLNLCT